MGHRKGGWWLHVLPLSARAALVSLCHLLQPDIYWHLKTISSETIFGKFKKKIIIKIFLDTVRMSS